jgi:hypothetical protein
MDNHYCDKSERWIEYDARGIPLVVVCPECRARKLKGFRREVLEDPCYDADEQIEPD